MQSYILTYYKLRKKNFEFDSPGLSPGGSSVPQNHGITQNETDVLPPTARQDQADNTLQVADQVASFFRQLLGFETPAPELI